MNRNYVFLFLQVLVEIDDEDWERREWFNVYKDNYQLFAVEQTLVLAKRSSGPQPSLGDLHPAFVSGIILLRTLLYYPIISKLKQLSGLTFEQVLS